MFPYLSTQRVNLQLFQEASCRELLNLIDKIDEEKVIVLDEDLLGPIGLMASPVLFSDRNIKLLRISAETRYPTDYKNVIYVTRPQLKLMDIIADHIQRKDTERSFHIFFVPRKSCLCLKHLEQKGILGRIASIEELTWNFFTVDKDIISMELPKSFKEMTVDGDLSSLYQAALGIIQLQKIYGRIPKVYGRGNFAQKVWESAKRLGTEDKTIFNSDKGFIDQMIILDRGVDLMSALVTQLTYEGLIDEIFTIRQNQVKFPGEIFAGKITDEASQSNFVTEKKIMFLNSGEKLYSELRDKNFNEVGKILSRNAKSISSQMGVSSQDKSVQDMKKLVDKLPELLAQKQSTANHTAIAEAIRKYLDTYEFIDDLAAEQEFMVCEDIDKPSAYIEDLIAKKVDFGDVIRLICIQCVAASGFKEKVLNYNFTF